MIIIGDMEKEGQGWGREKLERGYCAGGSSGPLAMKMQDDAVSVEKRQLRDACRV